MGTEAGGDNNDIEQEEKVTNRLVEGRVIIEKRAKLEQVEERVTIKVMEERLILLMKRPK